MLRIIPPVDTYHSSRTESLRYRDRLRLEVYLLFLSEVCEDLVGSVGFVFLTIVE